MPGTSSPSVIESLIVSGGSPNCTAPCFVITYTPPRGRKRTNVDESVTAALGPPTSPSVTRSVDRWLYSVRRRPRLTMSDSMPTSYDSSSPLPPPAFGTAVARPLPPGASSVADSRRPVLPLPPGGAAREKRGMPAAGSSSTASPCSRCICCCSEWRSSSSFSIRIITADRSSAAALCALPRVEPRVPDPPSVAAGLHY